MKWLFLINNASFLPEFLGKIAHQLMQDGEECSIVINSKMAEYEKISFLPKNSKIISKVDWCVKNYNSEKNDFGGLGWRDLFTVYERFGLYDYDYEKSLGMAKQLHQFFSYIFTEKKPDIVIGEPPAGLFGLAAYYFCRKNNIVFCGIAESRFPERIDIYDKYWTSSKYQEDFKELKKDGIAPKEKEFAKDFIKNFVSHKTIYSSYYLVKVKFSLVEFVKHYWTRLKELRKVFLQYLLNRNKFKGFDYESEAVLKRSFKAPIRTIIRNIKIPFQKSIFDEPKPKDKYFFFPMQYEPEASTLVLATYYSNQLATIKNVAVALPFPYKLYLKEHPGSIGVRTNKFYSEIKKIPNAVLLSSENSTPEIVANSAGVITMTSTVGMEAALASKPIYVLGNVFYSYHPLCRKAANFQDLEDKIKEDLVKNAETVNSEDDNIRFILSYFKSSIVANIFEASQKEDKNDYKMICSKVKKWILEQKTHG